MKNAGLLVGGVLLVGALWFLPTLATGLQTAQTANRLQWAIDGMGNFKVAGGALTASLGILFNNPTANSLKINAVSLRIQVNGKDFGSVFLAENDLSQADQSKIVIPGRSTKKLAFPVRIPLVMAAVVLGGSAVAQLTSGQPLNIKALLPTGARIVGSITANGFTQSLDENIQWL